MILAIESIIGWRFTLTDDSCVTEVWFYLLLSLTLRRETTARLVATARGRQKLPFGTGTSN